MNCTSSELRAIVYTGPSMNPTLQNLDKLFYAPCRCAEIKRGDVVVFLDQEKNIKVIHRVTAVDIRGIRTRGDNNSDPDRAILLHEQILGRVIYGLRANKRIRVHGGLLGTLQACRSRWDFKVQKALFRVLGPPYHLLSGRLRLPLSTRILAFQRPGGEELCLLMGGLVVGRLSPGKGWQIRPPFRLFLDESSLPKGAIQLGAKR